MIENLAPTAAAGDPSSSAGDVPTATMRTISSDECYRLMATQQIGRLGMVAGRYPLIFPVTFALDRGIIVIRTAPESTLASADHANVSFEVDQIDATSRSGWSVLIRGLAEHVTAEHSADLIAHTHATGVTPWAPGKREHWIRVIPHHITGRRIVPDEIPAWYEPPQDL